MEPFHCCKSFLFIGPTGDKSGQQRGLDRLGKGTFPTSQDHLGKSRLLGSQSPTAQDQAGLFSRLCSTSDAFWKLLYSQEATTLWFICKMSGLPEKTGPEPVFPQEASLAGRHTGFARSSSEPNAGVPQLERVQSCLKG